MFDWISSLFDKFFLWLSSLLPDWLGAGWSELGGLFGPLAKYFSWLLALDVVAPVIMGAYVVRFLIRRVPLIG